LSDPLIRTEALIDRYYAALKAGDRGALAGLLSPDMVVDYYGPEGLFPWQGRWVGLKQFHRFLDIVAENLTIDAVTPLQRMFTDSAAIIVLEGVWTLRDSGAQVRAVVANIFTLQDARISRYQVFTDTAAFGLGLGALALPQGTPTARG